MALTARRLLRQDFPQLGDDVWVEMKNPLLLPIDCLRPQVEPRRLPDGSLDMQHVAEMGYALTARLITAWSVYDATDESDDPARLVEVNPENLQKIPAPVEVWIAARMSEATRPPEGAS